MVLFACFARFASLLVDVCMYVCARLFLSLFLITFHPYYQCAGLRTMACMPYWFSSTSCGLHSSSPRWCWRRSRRTERMYPQMAWEGWGEVGVDVMRCARVKWVWIRGHVDMWMSKWKNIMDKKWNEVNRDVRVSVCECVCLVCMRLYLTELSMFCVK